MFPLKNLARKGLINQYPESMMSNVHIDTKYHWQNEYTHLLNQDDKEIAYDKFNNIFTL